MNKSRPLRKSARSQIENEERALFIGYLIHDVSRLRLRYFNAIFKDKGLTKNNWWTLANVHVQGKDGISQGELGTIMGVKKAMMGTIIDQLESSGHVRRTADKYDRRIRTIRTTAKGRALAEHLFDIVKSASPRFQDEISEEDLAITVKTLARMQENALAIIHEQESE